MADQEVRKDNMSSDRKLDQYHSSDEYMFKVAVRQARQELEADGAHRFDLINRAMMMARSGRWRLIGDSDPIAEALYQCLQERDPLHPI